LPDTPANTVQVHPQQANMVFLGTDIGVFLSEDGGQTWQPSANGFPTTQVVAIVLNTNLNRIYAATHGRGVYSAQLTGGTGTAELDVDTQEVAIQVKPGETGNSTFKLSNTGTADLSFNITTSGPNGAALNFSAVLEAGLSDTTNSSFPHLPPLALYKTIGEKPKTSPAQAVKAQNMSVTSPAVVGDDVLLLDDGNDMPDDFFGLQGSDDSFWTNRFVASENGFQLESSSFSYARRAPPILPSSWPSIRRTSGRQGNLPAALGDGVWYGSALPPGSRAVKFLYRSRSAKNHHFRRVLIKMPACRTAALF
jgi:hypothetical protein